MIRFQAKITPDRFIKRLQKACVPWHRSSYYKGCAFMLRMSGNRIALTKNGENGRTRPQRVFRGRIVTSPPQKGAARTASGTAVKGRFGMMTRDRLLVYLPAQLMVLLAAWFTPLLEAKYSIILWIAVLLSSFVVIGFMTAMDRILGAKRQKEIEDLLRQIGDKP